MCGQAKTRSSSQIEQATAAEIEKECRKSCWNQSKKTGKEICGLTTMYSAKFKENWFKILQETACTKIHSKTARTNSWKMSKIRREFTDQETFIIVDDEKYFTFSGEETPGNAGFYSSNKENIPDDVKFKSKQKFEPKILVWLALSSKGISTPFIGTTKGPAVDTDVYIGKCLPKLLKFIEKHHLDDKYIFWPDLASSHYANKTSAWHNEHKVPFVPKVANPPNVPKARPIEDFWSILADKVYSGGWAAMNQEQLVNRIKSQLKKIDLDVVQTMMDGIRKKLRKIEDKGPFSIL